MHLYELRRTSGLLNILILGSLTVLAVCRLGLSGQASSALPQGSGPDRVIAWNDLGMHCIDPDFSIFSILPPFNTINAQVIRNGNLVRSMSGLTLTYESIADGTGSINTTSIGKTNFWDHVQALFGVSPPVDVGLTGNAMPGASNTPQPMHFDPAWLWTQGEGIPLTPKDDALAKQPYPLMKISLRSGGGQELASTVPSVPNSQELLCSQCHASGTSPIARPAAGWVFHPDSLKDDRLNILRLHDERQSGNATYAAALLAAGYESRGLFLTAARRGTSILCSRCHGSNALPGTGMPGITPLTTAIHTGHADALNEQQVALDDLPTREARYTCHPGFDTQCLRGAMGKAVGADGKQSMDCQSCHAGMAEVGDPLRVGWLDQQTCQNCHTGSATQNSGQIRFDSAFDNLGNPHVAASNLFATEPDVPAAGFSLYRFSAGHGDLQCAACHGPPHAIYPTAVANDNQQNLQLQGHTGTLMECSTCHSGLEDNQLDDGPHGMHATTQKWVNDVHKDAAENNLAACQACHGADNRGSVLARTQTARTYNTPLGQKTFWDGMQISCYTCHNGPNDEDPPSNQRPLVPNLMLSTPRDVPLAIGLLGTDANGDPLEYRIVDQPIAGAFGRLSNGTVGLVGSMATFFPGEVEGPITFTYAANDGDIDSNLATVTVNVTPPVCGGTIEAYGFGCGAASGLVPSLEVTGCPEPGGSMSFEVVGGNPGGVGYFLQGTGRGVRELGTGCVLRVRSLSQVTPVLLGPGPGGQGAVTIPFAIPTNASGGMTFQFLIRDGSPGFVGRFTNAIELTVR